MTVSNEYREAHDATDYTIYQAHGLAHAAYELMTSGEMASTNDKNAIALISVILSLKDRLSSAQEQHEAEWEAVKVGAQNTEK